MDSGDLKAALVAHGVSDRIADMVCSVPRDRFVPPGQRSRAWLDQALPLEFGQTISQPSVVAIMTEAADVGPGDVVLDVGTGSGYQAAVLAACGAEVHSVERIPALAEHARQTLAAAGYDVDVRCGDGALGLAELAPFDAIVVAAATAHVPPALLEQLRPPSEQHRGGRLVIPLHRAGFGSFGQELVLIERSSEGFDRRVLLDVVFVPLVSG